MPNPFTRTRWRKGNQVAGAVFVFPDITKPNKLICVTPQNKTIFAPQTMHFQGLFSRKGCRTMQRTRRTFCLHPAR